MYSLREYLIERCLLFNYIQVLLEGSQTNLIKIGSNTVEHLVYVSQEATRKYFVDAFLPFRKKEEMFYLTIHSTHFSYSYLASDIIMVKNHSESERGNPLPPHGSALFD